MGRVNDDILMHYGIKRRSGRYPWGSGDKPFQRSGDFLSRVESLRGNGYSEKDVAREMNISTTELRRYVTAAKHERRNLEIDRIKSLRADGLTTAEIARQMGKNESSIRALENSEVAERKNQAQATADILRRQLESKSMIDVGAGVETELGISKSKLREALMILENEGYNVYGGGIPQVTNPGKQSNTIVLTRPEIPEKDIYQKVGEIQSVMDYHSDDGGFTYRERQYPASIDSSRVDIRYGDQGGVSKDGVIEIRRGVADLDLGNAHYAQVRILVDGDHYLKGMAMYSDSIPEGKDIVFNTNKKSGTDKMDVLKEIKHDDPTNPFGAYIKAEGQSYYTDKDGKQKLSAINKLKEEGDWDTMSRTLSSQFLGKQPLKLIKSQLDLTYDDAAAQFDEICSYTNPTIKKKMLLDFANQCDGATVHLKAAALPRQSTQVILPLDGISDTEIYAPNYRNGEQVALVRYPHGGTFEIPVLTVNNKNPSGKSLLGNVADAVGINAKVAERLSGADFDGDTVTVIPLSDRVQIKSTRPLKGLEGFDPKTQYAERPGMKVMTKAMTQKQMGMVSNLITDMTLQGATEDDIARAVRHSMVVIDAAKHHLDYKQSEKDNGIQELRSRYQRRVDPETGEIREGGASTLLSRKKQTVEVAERQGSGRIDPVTGEMVYKTSGRKYKDDKTGEWVPAMDKVSLMSVTKDVRSLSSGTPQEELYADYANRMKALANRARQEYLATKEPPALSSAREAYRAEVDTLEAKLQIAMKNAPRERRAQAIANSRIKAQQDDNPGMDKKALRKLRDQAIYDARAQVGANGKDTRITITDREWEAIQARAISPTKLTAILRYCKDNEVTQRALPKTRANVTTAKQARIDSMLASGYTYSQIADALNLSTSTVSNYARGVE